METEKGVLTFHQVDLIEGDYNPEEFFQVSKGLEEEPEGGQRCVECYGLRLEKTARAAKLLGYNIFDRIAKEGEAQFIRDMNASKEMTKEIYNNRSITIRIKESIIRLLSPIL